jgi:hypothetical protein
MNLLSFRFRFLPWWVALASTALGAPAADRPNLLVIQTDEHSFRTLGCYRALLPEAQAYVWGPVDIRRTRDRSRTTSRCVTRW